jgi:hypothetical protein
MPSPHVSGLARPLLGLIMAAALLFPEVGHGFAHRHAAEHRLAVTHDHHLGNGHADSVGTVVANEHGHADHPHLDTVASPSAKPILGDVAAVVRVAAVLLADLRDAGPVTPVERTGISPGGNTHGPPPPSRAPPQV